MKKLITALLVCAMMLTLISCGAGDTQTTPETPDDTQTPSTSEDEPITLTFGTNTASSSPTAIVMNKYAEDVAEASGGNITIEVIADAQLGSAQAEIEAVRLGAQDMWCDGLSWFSDYEGMENLRILLIPGLFKSNDHVRAYFESEKGQELWNTLEEQYNMHIICNKWGRTPSSWMTKSPIESVDDWRGMKLRVPEQQLNAVCYEYLGVTVTPIAWGDTYSAIQQGIVEGVDGPPALMFPMSFDEVTTYLTLTRHFYNQCGPVINADLWDSLSGNQRKILTECADNLQEYHDQLNIDYENEMIDEMRQDSSKVVVDLTVEESQALFAPLYSDDFKAIVEDPDTGYWESGLLDYVTELGEQF